MMNKLLKAIAQCWRAYKAHALEIELNDVNRLLQECVGEREALLHHREQTRKELAHARALWLSGMKPGKRRFFEVA